MVAYVGQVNGKPWAATNGRPIVGKRGWPAEKLTAGGKVRPGMPPEHRARGLEQHGDRADCEYWQLSQSGVRILRGSQTTGNRGKNQVVWVEDPSQFETEKDVFAFVHATYLKPEERCA